MPIKEFYFNKKHDHEFLHGKENNYDKERIAAKREVN